MSDVAALPSRALIALSGPDWRDFLQGLITQDVETLIEGELRFGALLTPQGRLLFDMFILGRADGAWLDVEAATREALVTRLTMYRLRAKVTIEAIDAAVQASFPDVAPGFVADPRLPGLGGRGYGLDAPVTVDEAAYDAHRLSLGVPGPADWAGEKTYPIEANFDLLHGIDFKKGCFVGQETTSRMKRRGQIKNRMLPLTYDDPPPAPGAEVLAGELRAGEALYGVNGAVMALVRLDRAFGTPLSIDGRPATPKAPDWLELPASTEV